MNLVSKWKIYFRPRAADDFRKLPAVTRKRIAKKMRFFVSMDNLLEFAKPLKDNQLGEHRFRKSYRESAIKILLKRRGRIVV